MSYDIPRVRALLRLRLEGGRKHMNPREWRDSLKQQEAARTHKYSIGEAIEATEGFGSFQ